MRDRLEMTVGDNFGPLRIGAYDWAQMAHENRLAPRLMANELRQMANGCSNVLPGLARALQNEGADRDMLVRVEDVVARQAAQALRVAPLIAHADKTVF